MMSYFQGRTDKLSGSNIIFASEGSWGMLAFPQVGYVGWDCARPQTHPKQKKLSMA